MKVVGWLSAVTGAGFVLFELADKLRNKSERRAVLTPLSGGEARVLLAAAFRAELGRDPTADEIAMLEAHSALETRRWQKMHNWNFGGLTAPPNRPHFRLPGNPRRFRADDSADKGARAFVSLLARLYPAALAAMGNPDEYARALKARGYFDEPLEQYQAALGPLFREFRSEVTP